MASIADELVSIPFLARASAPALRASAPLWELVSLDPGEALWDAGAAVDELAVVLLGELGAESGGVEVGRVLPGEICGEACFFEGAVRTATLRARTPTQALTLSAASLRTLRWQRSRVYEVLLEQSLISMVRRIKATDAKIAQVVHGGVAAPSRQEPSVLARLWKALRPGGPTGPCPPIEPLLRRLPGLREIDGESLAALTQAFVAEPAEEGSVLFLEGDAGSACYLVADGAVDVLRHVRGSRAELLAQLNAGDFFGANTLVEKGARTASCLAASPAWLYRMDAEAFHKLAGDTRMLFRECVLATLGSQIRNANACLERAVRGASPRPATSAAPPSKGDGFQDLLRASGYLEGLPAAEAELEQLEVVRSEDDRRNPKKRLR